MGPVQTVTTTPARRTWGQIRPSRWCHNNLPQSGVRFVDDGDVITTAAVLSGIDGSLRVVERMLGSQAAELIARQLSWSGYRPGQDNSIPAAHLAPADVVALLSAGYRWQRPAVGVLLTNGVGEIELASAFRPYTELSYLATLTSVSTDGQPIRSRHGLTFLPRSDWPTVARTLDRVLVPGTDAARTSVADGLEAEQPVAYLHQEPGFPFDGALRDIADNYDAATAQWVAKSLQYPAPDLDGAGPAWPWGLNLLPVLLATAGAASTIALLRYRRRRVSVPRTVDARPTPLSVRHVNGPGHRATPSSHTRPPPIPRQSPRRRTRDE